MDNWIFAESGDTVARSCFGFCQLPYRASTVTVTFCSDTKLVSCHCFRFVICISVYIAAVVPCPAVLTEHYKNSSGFTALELSHRNCPGMVYKVMAFCSQDRRFHIWQFPVFLWFFRDLSEVDHRWRYTKRLVHDMSSLFSIAYMDNLLETGVTTRHANNRIGKRR